MVDGGPAYRLLASWARRGDGARGRLAVEEVQQLDGHLGCADTGDERRQCVTKVVAAAVLWKDGEKGPTMSEVRCRRSGRRAATLEQARQAVEALAVMGKLAEKVSSVEYELRGYAHDITKPHYDQDYRSLAVFPLQELRTRRF